MRYATKTRSATACRAIRSLARRIPPLHFPPGLAVVMAVVEVAFGELQEARQREQYLRTGEWYLRRRNGRARLLRLRLPLRVFTMDSRMYVKQLCSPMTSMSAKTGIESGGSRWKTIFLNI